MDQETNAGIVSIILSFMAYLSFWLGMYAWIGGLRGSIPVTVIMAFMVRALPIAALGFGIFGIIKCIKTKSTSGLGFKTCLLGLFMSIIFTAWQLFLWLNSR